MAFGDHKVRAWPKSKAGWCRYFKAMDVKFGTEPNSPLHHNNRCTNHKEGN